MWMVSESGSSPVTAHYESAIADTTLPVPRPEILCWPVCEEVSKME